MWNKTTTTNSNTIRTGWKDDVTMMMMAMTTMWDSSSSSTSSSSHGYNHHGHDDNTSDSYRRRDLEGLEDLRIDYNVLSVGVVSLGLIMFVEVLRNGLDYTAKNRPFYKAVLEAFYTELATLGIVEFLLFLIASYYNPHHSSKYYLFSLIHFALFYTAILNAFQSLLLAYVATRRSKSLWIQPEMLELHHYVEIREAFDHVDKELKSLLLQQQQPTTITTESTLEGSHEQNTSPLSKHSSAASKYSYGGSSHVSLEMAFDFSRRSFINLFRSLRAMIRYPGLKRKYNQLLLQVRFHELRVNFLQSYNLPMKLRISDYLMRSEQRVFMKLVHVSPAAWLLLTGAINLCYYVLGMATYQSGNLYAAGDVLTAIFFGGMTFFMVMAWLLMNKMKQVFHAIMVEKFLWDVDQVNPLERERMAQKQRDLFWGGEPKLVIAAIQFMQFGYALALAVVIIFKDYINQGAVGIGWYIIFISTSYGVFLKVVAGVIPRYTLCTNLGQLVNEERLRESLADFYLKEAKDRELRLMEPDEAWMSKVPKDTRFKSPAARSSIAHAMVAVQLESGAANRKMDDNTKQTNGPSHSSVKPLMAHSFNENAYLMAELVKLDTHELRARIPQHDRPGLLMTEMQHSSRRSRARSLSDGVSFLANLQSKMSLLSEGNLAQNGDASPTVAVLQTPEGVSFLAQDELKPSDTLPKQLRIRAARGGRGRRQKSVSDGVASLAWIQPSVRTSEENMQILKDEEDAQGPLPNDGIIDLTPREDRLGHKAVSVPALASYVQTTLMKAGSHAPKQDPVSEEADDNDDSVGLSDTSDIPAVNTQFSALPVPKQSHRVSLCERLNRYLFIPSIQGSVREGFKRYFLSQRYKIISNVFGTMVAFFFVGQRTELFIMTDEVVPAEFVSFNFAHDYSFQCLAAWFGFFLIGDAILLWCMQISSDVDLNAERRAKVAAWMDVVIVSVCCTVLFVAEAQRCCEPTPVEATRHRVLNEPSASAETLKSDLCQCLRFGSRLYGGLGSIEPYTSLVSLRVFRHWVARRIVRYLNRGDFWTMKVAEESKLGFNLNPFDVFGDGNTKHGHGSPAQHGQGNELRGTAAELWEYALRKHPDIVARHGEFSAELLKAMLGLEAATTSMDTTQGDMNGDGNPLSLPSVAAAPTPFADGSKPLAPEDNAVNMFNSTSLRSNLDDSDSQLVSPDSRLIRGMRRCERKLLPILNKWTVIDVVLTRYEMVYFEATDDNGHDNNDPVANQTRQALTVTKGGKGLRLSDVAAGRRVVGHLELAEISSLHVDREILGDEPCERTDRPEVAPSRVEYWMPPTTGSQEASTPGGRNWIIKKQDTLQIETGNGRTLFLRFYSDLDEDEQNPDRYQHETETEGPVYQNTAFLWALTLGRLCGPEQLKQPLAHFGQDTDDELRDYLVIRRAPRLFEYESNRRLLRAKSRSDLAQLATVTRSVVAFKRGGRLRRARGMVGRSEHTYAVPIPARDASSFKETVNNQSRSVSTGDIDIIEDGLVGGPPAPLRLGRAVTVDVAELYSVNPPPTATKKVDFQMDLKPTIPQEEPDV